MARHTNPNALEGKPALRGDILLKSAAKLDGLTTPGFYAVTSPAFINGSKKFAIDNIPVGDVPRDIIQIQRPFDVGYPNSFSRTLTNGVWSAWTSLEATINTLADARIAVRVAETLLLRNITTKTIDAGGPTSLIPASVIGSGVLPANSWTELGSRIRVKIHGRTTTGVATTIKLDIQVDGATLAGDELTFPNNLDAMGTNVEMDITLVTATTVRITGMSTTQTAVGSATPFVRSITSAADITIDPTQPIALDLFATVAGGAGGQLVVRELTFTKM